MESFIGNFNHDLINNAIPFGAWNSSLSMVRVTACRGFSSGASFLLYDSDNFNSKNTNDYRGYKEDKCQPIKEQETKKAADEASVKMVNRVHQIIYIAVLLCNKFINYMIN